MGTKSTILIKNDYQAFYVHTSFDGYPEYVVKDIKNVLDNIEDKSEKGDPELVTTKFLVIANDKEKELNYYITSYFNKRDNYRFKISWNKETQKWEYGSYAG